MQRSQSDRVKPDTADTRVVPLLRTNMGVLVAVWNDWFLSVICLAVAALVPVISAYARFTARKPAFLDPTVFKELPLIEKKVLSYNTRLFR